jgi:hypothetical protein
VSSVKKISNQEILDFLSKLDGISGHVNSIYCPDDPDPEPMKLHGYEPPDDFNGFVFTKRGHMQLWLHNCGTLKKMNECLFLSLLPQEVLQKFSKISEVIKTVSLREHIFCIRRRS